MEATPIRRNGMKWKGAWVTLDEYLDEEEFLTRREMKLAIKTAIVASEWCNEGRPEPQKVWDMLNTIFLYEFVWKYKKDEDHLNNSPEDEDKIRGMIFKEFEIEFPGYEMRKDNPAWVDKITK